MSFNLLGAISSVFGLIVAVSLATTIAAILAESKWWWVSVIVVLACAFIVGGMPT